MVAGMAASGFGLFRPVDLAFELRVSAKRKNVQAPFRAMGIPPPEYFAPVSYGESLDLYPGPPRGKEMPKLVHEHDRGEKY
jgi:hypothetical protein